MIGNEHDGLTGEAIAAADVVFGIPMPGMTRSLNLSVAAALIVERAAQRRRRAIGRAGDLDDAAVLALRARFYAASVRGADVVLARAACSLARASDEARHRRARAASSAAAVAVWVAPTGRSPRNETT